MKLLSAAGPCRAYFGEKDFQQLALVRRVVRDLALPAEVVGCPTVREPDGLALSSRNARLSPRQRAAAAGPVPGPGRRRRPVAGGEDAGGRRGSDGQGGGRPSRAVALDYAALVDADDLEPARTCVDHPPAAGC